MAHHRRSFASSRFAPAVLAMVSVAASALAQAPDKPVLPDGPPLKPLPERCTWTVTTKMAKPGAKPSTLVSTGKKAGPLARIEVAEPDGSKTLVWANGNARVAYAAAGGDPAVSSIALEDDLFARIKWVSAENYEGTQKVDGKELLAFGTMVDDPEVDTDLKPPQIKLVALVDPETRLPVLSRYGNYGETAYVFGALPDDGSVEIPAEASAFLKAAEGEALKQERQMDRP